MWKLCDTNAYAQYIKTYTMCIDQLDIGRCVAENQGCKDAREAAAEDGIQVEEMDSTSNTNTSVHQAQTARMQDWIPLMLTTRYMVKPTRSLSLQSPSAHNVLMPSVTDLHHVKKHLLCSTWNHPESRRWL